MSITATSGTLAQRAAEHFGIEDLPRTSIRLNNEVCLIVLERDGKTYLYSYDETWVQMRGRIVKLTDSKRAALVAALQGTRHEETR